MMLLLQKRNIPFGLLLSRVSRTKISLFLSTVMLVVVHGLWPVREDVE